MASGFWSSYWRSGLASRCQRFFSTKCQLPDLATPTGKEINLSTSQDAIQNFLHYNFKYGPLSPTYKYEKVKDEIYITISDDIGIVGSIRSKPGGYFEDNSICIIDCFCVRSDWRRKGIGTYLLNQIQKECAKRNIYNAIFLKEGKPIQQIGVEPIYSSYYAFRDVTNSNIPDTVKQLQPNLAYSLLSNYSLLRPDTFLILNRETENQKWFHYKKDTYWVLAVVQNSYQVFKDGNTIGWITGWIESPTMTDEVRKEAAEDITSACSPYYNMIWMDNKWTSTSNKFMIDGSFHWYTYQWTTSLIPGTSYCIMS